MRILRVAMVEGQAIFDAGDPEIIVDVLRREGLVVFPTDTVYGLAADPFSAAAMKRLFAAKQRPEGLPVSIAVPNLDAAKEVAIIPERMEPKIRSWLPGPVTLILRPTDKAPRPAIFSETIAVRVPGHAVALLLAKRFGPITATSANLHGKPPPVECSEAREQLGDSVDVYVDAGPCPVGKESTVVDLTGREPRVIREGAVSAQRLGLFR